MCDERRFRVEDNQRSAENERGKIEKWLFKVKRPHEEMEMRMNEAIENRSLAEELCVNAEERERKRCDTF